MHEQYFSQVVDLDLHFLNNLIFALLHKNSSSLLYYAVENIEKFIASKMHYHLPRNFLTNEFSLNGFHLAFKFILSSRSQ